MNRREVDREVDVRTSLLDLLREHLHLFGAKKGCNQGACGACTILVDGERINSCLALAVQYEGREITTIKGLGAPGALHPLQEAFVEHDGLQCGYCTPGQICSAIGMVAEMQKGVPSYVTEDLVAEAIPLSHEELRERMSGNLCGCGAYNGIVEAIRETFGEAAASVRKREAGLWRSDKGVGEAFTMLTMPPGPDIAPYHDRQIAILDCADWAAWFDLSISSKAILKPLPAGALAVEPVG